MSETSPVFDAAELDDALNSLARVGHATIAGIFSETQVNAACQDLDAWASEFLADLDPEQRAWYLEQGGQSHALRKLDQPVFHRPVLRELAFHAPLVAVAKEWTQAERLRVCFSQVFMKPPEVGGAKPVHQDNFYFGPDRLDGMLTAWIALDEATLENGCLHFGETSHRAGVLPHYAPPDEPFNLQVLESDWRAFPFLGAPVPRGGASFHHGNTLHCSSANRSQRPRRAMAVHYLAADAELVRPALEYDTSYYVDVIESA